MMCQCGCGDTNVQAAFQIEGTKIVLGFQIFPGCRDCDYGPGVAVTVYDSPDVLWLDGVKIQKVKADEFGGNQGVGISVPVFDLEDLVAAAETVEKTSSIESYVSLAEWLEEHGYEFLRDAISRREKKLGGLEHEG